MLQATKIESVSEAEVYFLPGAYLAKAEKLLVELRRLNIQTMTLDLLNIYHQELTLAINDFPTRIHGQHILPELKSRRLAFACSIERMQNLNL